MVTVAGGRVRDPVRRADVAPWDREVDAATSRTAGRSSHRLLGERLVIRFSAVLVVVAVGLLAAGVVSSSLLLVYVAIGVSVVALVTLAVGTFLRRDEVFGTGVRWSVDMPDVGAGHVTVGARVVDEPPLLTGPHPHAAEPPTGSRTTRRSEPDGADTAGDSVERRDPVDAPAITAVLPAVDGGDPVPGARGDGSPAGAGEETVAAAEDPSGRGEAAFGDGRDATEEAETDGATGTAIERGSGRGDAEDDRAGRDDRPDAARDVAAAEVGDEKTARSPAAGGKHPEAGTGGGEVIGGRSDAPGRARDRDGATDTPTADAAASPATKERPVTHSGAVAGSESTVTDHSDGSTPSERSTAPVHAVETSDLRDGEPVAGDAAPHDAPQPDRKVTVVPGVPRYHRRDCLLIRFMGEDDLETMTLAEAETAGCTPCRACQPVDHC